MFHPVYIQSFTLYTPASTQHLYLLEHFLEQRRENIMWWLYL